MTIGIDHSKGDDTTVYTIPHNTAFQLLEKKLVATFHGSGTFNTHTSVQIHGGEMTFTVTVRKVRKEGRNDE